MQSKTRVGNSSFFSVFSFSSYAYRHLPVITIVFFSLLYLVWARWLQIAPQRLSFFPPFLHPSFNPHQSQDEKKDDFFRLGLAAGGILFVGLGGIHFPTTFVTYPHPSVWGVLLAVGLAYTLVLFFLLFQDWETPRHIMQWYDPRSLAPLKHRDYAEDCRLFTSDSWFYFVHELDIFIVAHFLGYVGKALILRDWRLVTCVSLGFELVEVTMQHVFPNFKECWWDHLLLDVLICNGGGTVCGMYILKWLSAKKYKFISRHVIITQSAEGSYKRGKQKTIEKSFSDEKKGIGETKNTVRAGKGGSISSAAAPIPPAEATSCQWNILASPKCFIWVFGLLVLVILQDYNVFLIMANLNIAPSYRLVTVRLTLFGLLGCAAVREYYEYISDPKLTILGPFASLLITSVLLENVVFSRMSIMHSHFKELMPVHIVVPWIFVCSSFAIWFFLFFGVLNQFERHGGVKISKKGSKFAAGGTTVLVAYTPVRRWAKKVSVVADFFFYFTLLGMAGLFIMGMPDLQWGRQAFEESITPYLPYILVWRS